MIAIPPCRVVAGDPPTTCQTYCAESGLPSIRWIASADQCSCNQHYSSVFL